MKGRMNKLSDKVLIWAIICFAAVPIIGGETQEALKMTDPEAFLIDDFNSLDDVSRIGTRWRRFTDQVMGGVSTASHEFKKVDGRKCILLKGDVSLENNGGFVQVSITMSKDRGTFDASGYEGLRLMVKGNGEKYHVHLKTGRMERPWQYFESSFVAGREWRVVELPFDKFQGRSISGKADIDRLYRIGIVGSKKEFKAEVAVARIELYKNKFYSFTMDDIEGNAVSLSEYKGKVLLVVNVASECGFTYQYEGLEKLYNSYEEKGFSVLGFPANNFGGQEPGTNEQIKAFCTSKFNVTFPMFAKISVKGGDIDPLYAYLTDEEANKPYGGAIKWNFNKFLIGKDGKTVGRFGSDTEPTDAELVSEVEKALKAAR
ncbi:MAG: CIA30 family protein [Planctomycetota bacterium]|jgi:glutathione peroxidase